MADFPSVREDGASTEIVGLDDNDDDLITQDLYKFVEHWNNTDGVPSRGVASSSSRHKPLEGAPHNPLEEDPHKPLEEASHNPLEEAPHDPLEEAPHNPLEEAPHNPLEEAPRDPLEEAPHQPLEEAPHNPLEEAPHNPLEEAPHDPLEETSQCGNGYQSTSSFLPQGMDGGSDSSDDIERTLKEILKSLNNTEMPLYKFRVKKNKAYRKIHMEMVENFLIVLKDHVIFIEVEGAQADHVVIVELRYMAGAHEKLPVKACPKHDDTTDSPYFFCVPKLSSVQKGKDQNNHLFLKIPVPNPAAGNGNIFTFPLMFRCQNFCHIAHGRELEIILKLCNKQNEVLKETHINLLVCTQVKREADKKRKQGSKRSSEEKTEGPAVKKVKHGVQEGGEGMQAGEAETPAPPPVLPPRQDERLCVLEVKCDPASLPALEESVEKLHQEGYNIEMKKVNGAPPDPPRNME